VSDREVRARTGKLSQIRREAVLILFEWEAVRWNPLSSSLPQNKQPQRPFHPMILRHQKAMNRINSLSREDAVKAFWACCGSDLYSQVWREIFQTHTQTHTHISNKPCVLSPPCLLRCDSGQGRAGMALRGNQCPLDIPIDGFFLLFSSPLLRHSPTKHPQLTMETPRGWPTPCLLQARRRCSSSLTPYGPRPNARTSSRRSVLHPPTTLAPA
jgi:hypothetical protein